MKWRRKSHIGGNVYVMGMLPVEPSPKCNTDGSSRMHDARETCMCPTRGEFFGHGRKYKSSKKFREQREKQQNRIRSTE